MGTTKTGPVRGLRVGELAEAVGVASDTIRYYERAGLLPPPQRTPAGYRTYGAEAVDRVKFIQGAQRLGLRLRDVADLLAVRDTGVCPCEPAEQLLRRRLTELDAEMARLTALRGEMVAMIDALPSPVCPPPTPGTWCPPTTEGGDLTMREPIELTTCCDDASCECDSGCC
jgi:DNA-binding transcriptional MerR regulator